MVLRPQTTLEVNSGNFWLSKWSNNTPSLFLNNKLDVEKVINATVGSTKLTEVGFITR